MPESDKLPHNIEAERTILGAVLINPEYVDQVIAELTTDDFFLQSNRLVFTAMVALSDRHTRIDTMSLFSELERMDKLQQVGGVEYVSQLGDGMPRLMHIENYIHTIKENSIRRNLIHVTAAICEQAQEGSDELDTILDRAEEQILHIGEKRIKKSARTLKQIVHENMAVIERIAEGSKEVSGLPTGYSTLDLETAGLQPDDLIILAARPSVGKTALALNIATNNVQKGKRVAIFSLEMSERAVLIRLLSSLSRIDAHKFRTGFISGDEWRKVTIGLSDLSGYNLAIYDASSPTVVEIAAVSRRIKKMLGGLDLLIVDYLQLIAPSGKRNSNRQEEVAQISRSLKALAKELGIPVLALSQLSRSQEKEDRRPRLSDLRESGAIEQDADVVLMMHRPHFYDKDAPEEKRVETEVIIEKQRNGPTGVVRFIFFGRYTRFEEMAPEMWNNNE